MSWLEEDSNMLLMVLSADCKASTRHKMPCCAGLEDGRSAGMGAEAEPSR